MIKIADESYKLQIEIYQKHVLSELKEDQKLGSLIFICPVKDNILVENHYAIWLSAVWYAIIHICRFNDISIVTINPKHVKIS
jgi:hypothetical protein